MKVFYNLFESEDLIADSNVTIGMFDGIHLGHRLVLSKLKSFKGNQNIVISFSNHPSSYFNPTRSYQLLCDVNEKLAFFKEIGIDIVYLIQFNEAIAQYPAEDFVEKILLEKLRCKNLILGYDNRFGKDREGTIDFVNNHFSDKINAVLVEPFRLEDQIISSSTIKELIQLGDIKRANLFLGNPYFMNGTVVSGKRLGSQIGFPTANLSIDEFKLIPPFGVYFVRITLLEKSYFGLTNIGIRPTVNDNPNSITVETHILDFHQDIYNQIIKVEFLEKVRDEKKFDSLEQLKNQISLDINYARKLMVEMHITS